VVECDGERVSSVSEKPQLQFLVNAGIYLLDPSALQYIPAGQNYDMPDLIQRLISEGRTVVRFPIVEYWLDVGRLADYETAQEDVRNGRISLLCKS
jgi:NDP-sugar pyrophosphorylase family protein